MTQRGGATGGAASVPTAPRPNGNDRNPLINAGRELIRRYGMLTAGQRPDPDFLVIGAKRGGTTSFYHDLIQHPNLCSLFPRPDHLPMAEATKGIHYFDQHFARGEAWYRSYLPTRAVRRRQAARVGGPVLVGEASPYYLFHPAAAARAHALLPDVKLIVLLRDPVVRAFSHWKERRREGVEALSFEDALAAEDERIGDDEERLRHDPTFYSYAHEQQSYRSQSEYAPALAVWRSFYTADRFLVLESEEYYRDPQAALDRTTEFLGLPQRATATGKVRNSAAGGDLVADTARRLSAHFTPFNRDLVELTGRSFGWS